MILTRIMPRTVFSITSTRNPWRTLSLALSPLSLALYFFLSLSFSLFPSLSLSLYFLSLSLSLSSLFLSIFLSISFLSLSFHRWFSLISAPDSLSPSPPPAERPPPQQPAPLMRLPVPGSGRFYPDRARELDRTSRPGESDHPPGHRLTLLYTRSCNLLALRVTRQVLTSTRWRYGTLHSTPLQIMMTRSLLVFLIERGLKVN